MDNSLSDMTSPFISPELERLLNPAYCCSILAQYTHSYTSSSTIGLPYPLLFLCLPLVLHENICQTINEYGLSYGLHSFITKNPFILIELSKRVDGFLLVTQKTLLFGIASGTLFVEPHSLTISSAEAFVRQIKVTFEGEMFKPYQAAQRLGKWFSQLTIAEVFLFLGIQP
jgi:Family of unknown function (DUF6521)